ncbi:hypothetical protein OF83DRAFT_806278 [Amylostereum chailletii]|nr:hypothetical protein OF83DRAFT_806278 [Amylostereum chailletii]
MVAPSVLDDEIPPVGGLPVEILARIFTLIHEEPPEECSAIRVSHVCQHWRVVAISTSQLWTRISDRKGIDMIKLQLERSDTAPLSVTFHRYFDADLKYYDKAILLLGELSRITSMELTFHPLDIEASPEQVTHHEHRQREMAYLLDVSPAPLLRNLQIAMPWMSIFRDTIPSPSIFASATPPDLQHLEFYDCVIPMDLHLLNARLTHLEIHSCLGWTTMDQLLDMLARSPTLSIFVFSAIGLRHIREVRSRREDSGSVILPNLKRLHLRERTTFIADILRHLSFPSNVEMTIDAEEGIRPHPPPQEIADLLEAGLQPHFPPSFDNSGSSFETWDIHDEDIDVCMFTISRPPDADGVSVNPSVLPNRFHLSLSGFRGADIELHSLIPQVLARLPGMTRLKTIIVNHTHAMSEAEHWRTPAAAWRDVETVSVGSRAVSGFVNALNDETTVLFPKLTTLNIEGADLCAGGNNTIGVSQSHSTTPIIDTLTAVLARRQQPQFSPRIGLTISECDIAWEKVRTLSRIMKSIGSVAGVIWDGKPDAVTRENEASQEWLDIDEGDGDGLVTFTLM